MHSRTDRTSRAFSREPFERFLDARRDEPVVLLHSCGHGRALLYEEPLELCVVETISVERALDRLADFLARNERHRCAGFLGYDLRDAVERLPRTIEDDLPVPVVFVAAFERVTTWPALLVPPAPTGEATLGLRAHVTRADYEARVARIVEHIRAGDVFQANLTQPFSGRFRGDARALFWRACEVNPAPFSACVDTGRGLVVLSSSPEEFVRVSGGHARSRPIKGTRPRHSDPDADARLLAELLASDKDLAELAMIVDLMRNDLGKVARAGSVTVGAFPELRSFVDVHHLFATVRARLREDATLADVLRATFPPGSITGAPKLRCMEILEALEVVRRGVYTGAIGRFGPGRRMHLNVAIRTMTIVGERVRCNAGGGITADSVPALEFEETLHKAAGMLRVLRAEVEWP
jgi:aminodeoxychorismate synthase component I